MKCTNNFPIDIFKISNLLEYDLFKENTNGNFNKTDVKIDNKKYLTFFIFL